MVFEFKRDVAVYKKINEINENDTLIRLIGTIIDKQEGFVVLDDGSNKAEISVEDSEKFNLNETFRVIVRVIPLEGNFELKGEIFQSMSNVNLELYKKVFNDY